MHWHILRSVLDLPRLGKQSQAVRLSLLGLFGPVEPSSLHHHCHHCRHHWCHIHFHHHHHHHHCYYQNWGASTIDRGDHHWEPSTKEEHKAKDEWMFRIADMTMLIMKLMTTMIMIMILNMVLIIIMMMMTESQMPRKRTQPKIIHTLGHHCWW